MGYIDAGYVVALSVLAVYAGILWRRWKRLERRATPPVHPSEP